MANYNWLRQIATGLPGTSRYAALFTLGGRDSPNSLITAETSGGVARTIVDSDAKSHFVQHQDPKCRLFMNSTLLVNATTLLVPFTSQRYDLPGGVNYRGRLLSLAPLLYWRLNEVAGETSAKDETTNLRTGALGAGVTLGTTGALTGDSDKAVTLSNTSTGVITSSYNPFVVNTTKTFEGWSYRNATTDVDSFFGDTAGTVGFQAGAGVTNGVWSIGADSVSWVGAIPTAQWFHWALIYNDTTQVAELYINGVSKGTRTITGTGYGSPGNFKVGDAFAGSPWNGRMDEITLHSGGLNSYDIILNYNIGIASGMHNASLNPSRMTATKAGVYHFGAVSVWPASSTGYRIISLRHTTANGGTTGIFAISEQNTPSATFGERIGCEGEFYLAVGDYVQVELVANVALTLPQLEYYGPVEAWGHYLGYA